MKERKIWNLFHMCPKIRKIEKKVHDCHMLTLDDDTWWRPNTVSVNVTQNHMRWIMDQCLLQIVCWVQMIMLSPHGPLYQWIRKTNLKNLITAVAYFETIQYVQNIISCFRSRPQSFMQEFFFILVHTRITTTISMFTKHWSFTKHVCRLLAKRDYFPDTQIWQHTT